MRVGIILIGFIVLVVVAIADRGEAATAGGRAGPARSWWAGSGRHGRQLGRRRFDGEFLVRRQLVLRGRVVLRRRRGRGRMRRRQLTRGS